MNSIRRYLLRTLVLALIAGSALTTLLVYLNVAHEINELYNENMVEVAKLLQDQIATHEEHFSPTLPSSIAQIKGEEEMLIQAWQPSGRLVYSSHPSIVLPLQEHAGRSSTEFQHDAWHVYRTGTDGLIIQTAQPNSARKAFMREMALNMLYPMLAQIPLIGLFIWLAVGKSLEPLSRVSRAIQGRSAYSLEPLEDPHIPDEIKPMVQELNALLARLDSALSAQKQFTMDAAHELRTPLAAIKLQLGNLERAEIGHRQVAMAKLNRGVDRASHVVQQLLTFARLEPESNRTAYTLLDLAVLAASAVEAYAEIAYAKQIDLGLTRHEKALITGDAGKLRIVIDNLIDNAIRYTPVGGKVDVAVYTEGDSVVLEIKDSGIGVAEAERERIFERFYRVVGNSAEGTGLGLAIVKHVVDEHGGQILVTQGIDGAGAGFVLRLPSQV